MCKRLCLCIPLAALVALAAPAAPAATRDKGDGVFETGKVVQLHLRLDAKEFARLRPAGGGFPGFGPPGGAPKDPIPGTHRNTFGLEFPWAKGDLTHDGKTLKGVGVRYKGNFTYMASPGLKKSLKIDLGRNQAGQKLDGLKTLNLNCGVTDPS